MKMESLESQLVNRSRLYMRNISANASNLAKVSKLIWDCISSGGHIYIAGNGGSAAEAQHFAGELIGRFSNFRKPFPAVALNSDVAVLTCIANDFGYEEIFSRQIEALVTSKDLVIVLSTSGKSRNIERVLEEAAKKRAKTVLFTGANFVAREDLEVSHLITSPSSKVSLIQEFHLACIHIICQCLEEFNDEVSYKRPTSERGQKFYNNFFYFSEFMNSEEKLDSSGSECIFLNGCFDLLHAGHFSLLREANNHEGSIVVAINSDRSVRLLKGESRPIIDEKIRAQNLLATGYVDLVLIFDEDTPLEVIKVLKPLKIVTGSEYRNLSFPERDYVEQYGGVFHFIEKVEGFSTTSMVGNLLSE